MSNAKEILEQLTELYAQRDLLHLDQTKARDNAIPAEVAQALADVDAEFMPKHQAVAEKIEALEAQIKTAVLAEGESVKGGVLQAVYAKGRVTWDGKKLDGMMSLIPQLEDARKVGEPSVSIRKVG